MVCAACTLCLIPKPMVSSHQRHQPCIEFFGCLFDGLFLYCGIHTTCPKGKQNRRCEQQRNVPKGRLRKHEMGCGLLAYLPRNLLSSHDRGGESLGRLLGKSNISKNHPKLGNTNLPPDILLRRIIESALFSSLPGTALPTPFLPPFLSIHNHTRRHLEAPSSHCLNAWMLLLACILRTLFHKHVMVFKALG